MKSIFTLACVLFFFLQALPQAPVNNPVAASIAKTASWTSSLPWKKTWQASDVANLIDEKNYVDSAKLASTLQSISEKGGGVLYFGSGSFYFNYDLALPDNVIIRGEAPAGNEWLTKLVFPKLYLAMRPAPKSNEPYATAPKKIWYAGKSSGFTGLVNVDVNRATISLKGAKQAIVYGVRSNNASQLDASVPTATQVSNRQGWQIWPDRNAANVEITADNALVAQSLFNDQVTDNLSQPDFMTDDGMRFDGSRAEYRVTDHTAINATAKSLQITGNTIHISQGYEPIVANGNFTTANTVSIIPEINNQVTDGKSATGVAYNLLYKDEISSESHWFVSEFNDSLPYRLIKPANYDPSKKYPLVVFMHDFWEKGNDNKRHLRQFVWQFLTPENQSKFPCFIVAPQLPMSEPKWKTDGLGSETWPIQCSSLLITELESQFPIDKERVYAVGNSMGGAGALNLAIQHPDQVAAVVAVSVFYRLTKNSSLQVSKIPLWFIYGEKDERIDPVIRQSIRTDLRGANAIFKYTEIPGMGHRCWNDVATQVPDLMGWLFAQKKQTSDVAKQQ